MLDAAVLDQRLGHALSGVAGDRIADTVAAAGVAPDLCGDADDPALRVEDGPAGVAVVERGVGLDGVLDREAVRGPDLASDGADHACGQRAFEPEGAAEHSHPVADVERSGRCEAQRRQLGARPVDVKHGDVRGWIGADDLGLDVRAVRELDAHRLGTVDDMLVGDDVAVLVDDEAAARPFTSGLIAEGSLLGGGRGMDLDDRVFDPLVERGRRGRRFRDGLVRGGDALLAGIGVGLERNRRAHAASDARTEEERRDDCCELLAQDAFLSMTVCGSIQAVPPKSRLRTTLFLG
jgi:hypothetical protein